MKTETLYPESDRQTEQRDKSFTYHAPHGDQADRYAKIRDAVQGVSLLVNTLCPPSRELSLAQTNLEQAVMWANAAIARNECDKPQAD